MLVGYGSLSLRLPSSVSQACIKHLLYSRPDSRPCGAGEEALSHHVLWWRNREITSDVESPREGNRWVHRLERGILGR